MTSTAEKRALLTVTAAILAAGDRSCPNLEPPPMSADGVADAYAFEALLLMKAVGQIHHSKLPLP